MDMVKEQYILSKNDAELPEEFGFYYPNNIKDTWDMVTVLEVFKMWPDPGGFLDQNAFLIDDILTLKRIKDWTHDENKPKGDEG